jgi:hypothetical protein
MESYGPLGAAAMQFLNALAEAALASSAAGTDVTNAAFISGALRELGVTLCIGKVCMLMQLQAVPVRAWTCMCLLLTSRRVLAYFCYAFSRKCRR